MNEKTALMKHGSTTFLKGVLILIGGIVIGLCALLLPDYLRYPVRLVGYLIALPLIVALWQAFKLLGHIDQNNIFSAVSVAALKNIKYCAAIITVLVSVGTIWVALSAGSDVARIIELGLVLALAACVIATFAAVLQQLFQKAVDLKAENDLTV